MLGLPTTAATLPSLVVAADWGTDERKRWMARAVLDDGQTYQVYPPEPVGDQGTLPDRLWAQAPPGAVVLGVDFPIGLPRIYAERCGFASFRKALEEIGRGDFRYFFDVSDQPTIEKPFYPPPTGKKGEYTRARLARSLGVNSLSEMLRRCDQRTVDRPAAECLFFTLGGKQVGRAAIDGWANLIQPWRDRVGLWPFDGEFGELIEQEEIVIAEIYPAEGYRHLGFEMGAGTGLSKRRREHRRTVAPKLLACDGPSTHISHAAKSWIEWGFASEDDFDAMVGLLSMLRVVTGRRSADTPEDEAVRHVEGWILGQDVTPHSTAVLTRRPSPQLSRPVSGG